MPKLSNKYHKIMSPFKRRLDGDRSLIIGDWSTPELNYLQDLQWEFTEKIDGMNIRIHWDGSEVNFAGRSDDAVIPTQLLQKLTMTFKDSEGLARLKSTFDYPDDTIEPLSVTLYGEGYGAGIQKAGRNYIPDGKDFILFDVKVGNVYLKRDAVNDIAKKLNILSVPVMGHGTLADGFNMAKAGIKSAFGDFQAEGTVARPMVELFTRMHDRVIVKIKCVDFK